MSEFSTMSMYYFCNNINKDTVFQKNRQEYRAARGGRHRKRFQVNLNRSSRPCWSPSGCAAHTLYREKTLDQRFANILTKILSRKYILHQDPAYIRVYATRIKPKVFSFSNYSGSQPTTEILRPTHPTERVLDNYNKAVTAVNDNGTLRRSP